MIKEGLLVGGIVFYAFVISTLIGEIRDQNFTKSFLRIIDNNDDGIITEREIKEFKICDDFDHKKLDREFREFGRRADLNELSKEFTPKAVLKSVEKCVGNVEAAINPEHLKGLSKEEVESTLLDAYDLDNDNEVKWSEFHIGNQFLSKKPKNARQLFRFFDKDHNWRISHKEIQKAKIKHLESFLGSGKRK